MSKRSHGFTLIELMMAVVVLAILASIAIPSYQESVRRSRRAELQTAMLSLAHSLERYYTANNSYTGATLGAGGIFPATVPAQGTANYNLALNLDAGGQTYSITATPAAGGPQQNDKCGTFSLTAAGAKTSDGATSECWTN